jgi:hypothetical protein
MMMTVRWCMSASVPRAGGHRVGLSHPAARGTTRLE